MYHIFTYLTLPFLPRFPISKPKKIIALPTSNHPNPIFPPFRTPSRTLRTPSQLSRPYPNFSERHPNFPDRIPTSPNGISTFQTVSQLFRTASQLSVRNLNFSERHLNFSERHPNFSERYRKLSERSIFSSYYSISMFHRKTPFFIPIFTHFKFRLKSSTILIQKHL